MNRKYIIRLVVTAISLTVAAPSAVLAQNTVTGSVVNSLTHEKFAGASITVVGTDVVAMSDGEGQFSLGNAKKDDVLLVEAPGCEMQFVAVRDRNDIVISLTPKSDTQPFYSDGSLSPFATVSVNGMNDAALSASDVIGAKLNGDVRSIAQSGIDAAGSAMLIRGIHSINMANAPLFVVDGVIWQSRDDQQSILSGYYSNPLALISPDDIESIQVLRNGTALYGAKASNGVVVINTKRSHNMATEISVNVWAGMKSPFKSIPMMNASDYRTYATDIMRGMKDAGSVVDQLHFTDDDASGSYYAATHNDTDWNDVVNKSAFTQNYSIGVRGGDDIALYSFSLGYAHNDGNIDNTDFSRLNVRFNSDIKFTKSFTAKADISFAQITRNLFNDGMDEYASPLYLSYIKSPLYSPYQYDTSGNLFDKISDKDELGVGNPLAVIGNADGKVKNYRFTASFVPKYQFLSNAYVSALVGFSWDKIKESAFTPDFGLAERPLYNDQGDWYGDGNNSVASLMTRHSTVTLGADVVWDALKGVNTLSLHGGFSFMNNTYESNYGMGYNTGSDNLKNLSVTNSDLRTMLGLDDNWRSVRWNLVADYNFRHRYFITAIAAMESNSRFGDKAKDAFRFCGTQWGIFPSVTGAWVVSNERFMKGLPFVDFLKVYTGYEITGNDDIPVNASRAYFENVNYAGLANGLAISNVGNGKLTFEKTATWNVGIDLRAFGNRLSVGAEYYISTTNNLLVQKQLGEEYGLKYYWTNDGKLGNRGFNVNVDARIVEGKDWRLNAGLSLGHYKNEIKSLGNGGFTTSVLDGTVLTAVGQPLGVFYGYKTLGVFATKQAADEANLSVVSETGAKSKFGAGDMHFADLHADGIIDENDRTVIGDPNPDIYGNFHLNLQYRRFALETLFTYSLGNDAYNSLRASLESGKDLHNQTVNLVNRWTADGQVTSVPRVTYGDPMGNARFSDRWIEDASYLRLKQITASYTLPIKPRLIQGAKIWVSVNNVFTLSKYLGADPEFFYGNSLLYQGVDAGLTPSARSYNIGIKLNI